MLTDFFDGRVLALDARAAREYARMLAHRRSVGRSLPMQDGMIAAIAYSNGATVATRNVPDFTDCGVPVINPWESASIPVRGILSMRLTQLVTKTLREDPPEAETASHRLMLRSGLILPGGGGGLCLPAPSLALPAQD